MAELVVGIDIGTSGIRALAADAATLQVQALASVPLPPPCRYGARISQPPAEWAEAFDACVDALNRGIDRQAVRAVALDGTSGTLLVTDDAGRPLADALLYNDAGCTAEAARVAAAAPPAAPVHGAASGLARLLHLAGHRPDARHALHQADWLAGRLHGRFDLSDEHNALKTGYDPQARRWPAWLLDLLRAEGIAPAVLPQVLEPGHAAGRLSTAAARRTGWPADCVVGAGSTDGVAAFLATGADREGDAVTSLGSTLVVKLLSRVRLASPRHGVYSHRLGDLWLPGGASNAGGAALLQHFSAERMAQLQPRLRPDEPTGLRYYPLPAPGERFPVADPALAPVVTPRPDDDVRFLQGLLEGLADVEAQAYGCLQHLGAARPARVFSVGGGARNEAFTRIRARRLGVPMAAPAHEEAAAGAARLAAQALRHARAA